MPAVFFIAIGAIVLAACLRKRKGTTPRSSGGEKEALRIDHLRCYELDEYECSVCGARFGKQSMVCPRCGVRFHGTREDETGFDEEILEEEDWDEEEGR